MRIAILGVGGSGKDTAAGWISECTGLKYDEKTASTSRAILNEVVKVLGGEPNELYDKRREHRQVWYEVGQKLKSGNPAALVQWCVSQGNEIVTGIRSHDEFVSSYKLFDLRIWIERPGFEDITSKLSSHDCDIVVENISSYIDFHRKISNLCKLFTARN